MCSPTARGHLSTASFSDKPFHQARDLQKAKELARPQDPHGSVVVPIEVTGSGVHGDDELRVRREGAFEEPVVRLMRDHVQLGEGVALTACRHDLGDELRMVSEHIRVLLEDRGTNPRLEQIGSRKFNDER